MSDPVAIAAQLKQRAAASQSQGSQPSSAVPKAVMHSSVPWYLRNDNKWSLYEDKSDNPQQKLNLKAAGAAVTLVAMYFTGHIERAYNRDGGDGSVPMLASFLIFMSLSVISKCITMHIRNWVASAKIRLDEKRKARAAQEAEDSAAAAQVSPVPVAGVGAALRRRTGKTKKS